MMLALIPLFPLLGFLINGCWYAFFQMPAQKNTHKHKNHGHSSLAHSDHHSNHAHPNSHASGNAALIPGIIASLAIFSSFILSVLGFIELHGLPEGERVLGQTLFNWIQVGSFQLNLSLSLDPLSSLFTLLITGVGTLIHLYSIGYMSHDETPGKFFSYLNLFCFAMLVLVLGSSLPVLFFGWEGVGLCSYLLIGYWYTDPEKASAGKKAFIVNRVGDLGFLLGMFLIFSTFGTLEFSALKTEAVSVLSSLDTSVITAICLLLFVGCMGKSAQIPLYVWLPDAMAGPTPVSALIHAATMVTSGIYLISRLNFLFLASPVAMNVVAIIGLMTAFFAATIAIAQKDIKKVLAYSTVSQLGYMFLACGVGAFSAGVFHVLTHGFFKALLFLGAGSVIHGMHEEQDILKMGGLKSKMPKTFLVFAIAWLAICGIPPLSGFFSKDEILWYAYSSPHGSTFFWIIGALTAMMTAFYMTRLFSLTFLGKTRHTGKPVHESPAIMTVPLQILAVLSALGGFLGIPHMSWLEHWLEPVIPSLHSAGSTHASVHVEPAMEWVLMGFSTLVACGVVLYTLKLYRDLNRLEQVKKQWSGIYKVLENKWYIDEIYEFLLVRPIHALSNGLWKKIDVGVIDRIVLGFGWISQRTGQTLRVLQTGSIQTYAFMLLVGLAATVGYLIYGILG